MALEQLEVTYSILYYEEVYLLMSHSNGDPEWSAGPPKDDSIMKIGKIEMYYNTTGSPGACF